MEVHHDDTIAEMNYQEQGWVKSDFARQLERELNDARNWNPIETAPKTDRILLCLGGQDWAIGSWNKDSFDGPEWQNDGLEPVAFIVQPTHWMPLPDLPVNADKP